MFEIFVVGPVATAGGLGLMRRCMDCRAARGADADECTGLGDGCLVLRKPTLDSDEAPGTTS